LGTQKTVDIKREINIKTPETTCEGERKHFVGMEQLLKKQVKYR
jgi:hypothetical protein